LLIAEINFIKAVVKNPMISVVLPIYNAAGFLREALESVLAQTFKDWELIAIDDGSNDDSLAILQAYATDEPKMRIVTRPNKGLVATLNEGIAMGQSFMGFSNFA